MKNVFVLTMTYCMGQYSTRVKVFKSKATAERVRAEWVWEETRQYLGSVIATTDFEPCLESVTRIYLDNPARVDRIIMLTERNPE